MRHQAPRLCALVALAALVGGCADLGSAIRSGQEAEISFDGLHRVRGAFVDRLWVRPGASLEGKTKILPSFAGLSYRKATRERTKHELSSTQIERLEGILHEVFLEELARGDDWQITDVPGPDVVIVRAWLVDVVINTPPRDTSARTRSWVASAGEATLVVEVFDAETHQILARVADRQSAQRAGGGLMRSVPTDNQAAVRRMFRHWAMRLRHGLDEVRAQGTFEIL